ncbi:phosphopantetheine adenylyltransferase [Betaproteobacteria bacterium]|nr:phosphopantetheine adenylyltransferase [Betaproteobacteria bacterium]GHT99482.1 phosphopantetheine adenylyltransferase [Betaproteobacteria bacterium]GHT99646.1 phosphopantetheine adenylyltransferase [Betaproteobacteria bacterium]GHU22906.1 phosphopantetheine adenylyltransferase [Betaproteobacteria bacterium]GHU28858.1 phosphopantetheine adenylyltransferase [Betaproteobacteria bacterium]
MKDTVAVYPGTFDPFTRGHEDLVRRAVGIFDHVIVAIAVSAGKGPLFSLDERIAIAREVLQPFPTVEVASFNTLLIEFARQRGAKVVLRGLRAVSDFEYEVQMTSINRKLCPEIETLFLTPTEEYSSLSSSVVREIARFGGDVSRFVHPTVIDRLQQKF